jgi:hypothetical protein
MPGQPAGVSARGTPDAALAGRGGSGALRAPGEPQAPADPIVAFLVRFSVALHKHSTYPSGHPTMQAADDAVAQALVPLFAEREELRIGVARESLVIDDEAMEGHAVLRELAERLHRRSVGGLLLRRGLTAAELGEVLAHLSGDAQALRDRLLGEGEPLPEWPHAEVVAHAFRRLALAGDGDASFVDGTQRLWRELAATAFTGREAADDSAEAIARELDARAAGGGSAVDARRLLLTLGRAARAADGAERQVIDARIRELMGKLRPATIRWLFAGEKGAGPRALREAVDVLPADSVLLLLDAASGDGDRAISHQMLRLLGKLSRQAVHTDDGDDRWDGALRETARELVDRWTLENPNPESHTYLLDTLSRQEASVEEGHAPAASEGRRIVQIALETASLGDHVLEAAEMMVQARELGGLLDLLDHALHAPATVAAVRAHLRSPAMLRTVLLEEPVDPDAAQRLLAEIGLDEAPGLLDALEISEAQGTRRIILERLAALGAPAAPLFVERLERAPWYVQRNLLALLARLRTLPAGFSARPWAASDEVTVRYHALGVMLRQPAERDEAIQLALADADPRVVRFGLESAVGGLPRAALPRLMTLLNAPQRPLELRTRGILLLQQVHTPAVRDWLLEKVLTKRSLLRGRRLQPRSPEVLAALVVLARRWASAPDAALALRLAAESGDAELAAAARGEEPA